MSSNRTIDAVIFDMERLIQVWTENPSLFLGDITLESLKSGLALLKSLRDARNKMQTELDALIDQTNDQKKRLDEQFTRGKSGIKATFGTNSIQYGQVGGTRQSERKSPKRKTTKAPDGTGGSK